MKRTLTVLILILAVAAAGCITAQKPTQPPAPATHTTHTATSTPPAYDLVPQKIITASLLDADNTAIQYAEIHDNTLIEHFRLENTAITYEKDGTLTAVYNGMYEKTRAHAPRTLTPTLVYSVDSTYYLVFRDGYETIAVPILSATARRTTTLRVPVYVIDNENLYPAGTAEILYTPVTTASTLADLPTHINPQAVVTHTLEKFMDTRWTDITNSMYRRAAEETSAEEEKTEQIIVTFTASPAVTYLSKNYAYTSYSDETTSYQYLYIVLNYTDVLKYSLTYNAPGTHITINIDKTIHVPYLDGTTAYTEFYPEITAKDTAITFLWFIIIPPENSQWTSTILETNDDYCYCYTTIRDIRT